MTAPVRMARSVPLTYGRGFPERIVFCGYAGFISKSHGDVVGDSVKDSRRGARWPPVTLRASIPGNAPGHHIHTILKALSRHTHWYVITKNWPFSGLKRAFQAKGHDPA